MAKRNQTPEGIKAQVSATPGVSWWSSVPGMLTAAAALLTAIAGLIAAFSSAGLSPAKPVANIPASAASAVNPMAVVTPPASSALPPRAESTGATPASTQSAQAGASGVAVNVSGERNQVHIGK